MKKHTKIDFLKLVGSEEMDSYGALPIIQTGIAYLKDIIGEPQSTLSVGCGAGAELGFFDNVKGIDLNDTSLSYCKQAGYDVQKMDMHDMTFEDNTFDLVFARDVFEHALSPIEAISEMARVSKKYVCIIVPDETWQSSKWHFICPTTKQMQSLGEKVGLQLKALREYNVIIGMITIQQSLYLFEKHV